MGGAEVMGPFESKPPNLTPQEEKPKESNPFLDAVEANPELRARLDTGGRLDNAIWNARRTTPERWSVVMKLSQQAGLPPEVVDGQFDRLISAYASPNEPEKARLLREYPRTAAWFSNKDNASVALPDLEGFRRLDGAFQRLYGGLQPMTEAAIKESRRRYEQEEVPRIITEGENTLIQLGISPTYKQSLDTATRLGDRYESNLRASEAFIAGHGEVGTLENLAQLFGDDPTFPLPWFGALGRVGKAKQLWEAAQADKGGTARWAQKDLLFRTARLQEAGRLRGTTTGADITEGIIGLLPYGVEFASTSGIYSMVKGAIQAGGREAAKTIITRALQNALTNRATAFVAGATAQAAVGGSFRTLAGTYERMLIHDEDLTQALPKAFADQVIEYGTERAGAILGFIDKPIGRQLANWFRITNPGGAGAGFVKMLKEAGLHGLVGEAFEEEAGKFLRDVTGLGPAYKPPTERELITYAGIFGLPMLAGLGAGALSRRGAESAQSKAMLLNRVSDEIAALKTNERSPAAVEDAVRSFTEGTPVENVFVPAEFWQDYWVKQKDKQGNAINPREMAARVIGSAVPYDQTLQAKADLQIPMSKYARYVAPEHGKAFADEVRLDPLEMNGREATDFLKALDAEDASAQAPTVQGEAVPIPETAKPPTPSEQVRNIVTGALEQAKVHPVVARRYAQLYEAGFRTLGKRAGVDPLELFTRYKLSIGREGFEAPVPAGQTAMEQGKFTPAASLTAPEAIDRAKLFVGEQGLKDRTAAVVKRGIAEPQAQEQAAREIVKERQYEQPSRGRIRIATGEQGKPLSAAIDLFKNADLSTFLHESGHFYLTVLEDLAQGENAPADIKADYEAARKFVGARKGEAITVEQHEKWARGFEAYLMEGKAPTPELRDAFHRFKSWLVQIYKTAKSLFADLNPEIRGVFDRLLASEEEIKAAQEQQAQKPMFAELQADFDEAKMAAEKELDDKLRAEYARERAKWWKEARAKEREAAERQVNELPVYKALANMQKGTLPDGSPLPEGQERVKLSKEDIIENHGGADRLRRLPKPYIYAAKGGISVDTAAQMFGFSTGEELLAAIETVYAPVMDTEQARIMAEIERLRQEREALEQERKTKKSEIAGQTAQLEKESKATVEERAAEIQATLRREERASMEDVNFIVKEYGLNKGVMPTDPGTKRIPPRFKKKYEASSKRKSDDLAQRMHDAGILKDAYSDTLYDWLEAADAQLKDAKARDAEIPAQAKKLAREWFKGKAQAIVENAERRGELLGLINDIRGKHAAMSAEAREGAVNPRIRKIEQIADYRMKSTYGDLIEDYKLPDEAMKAVHSEKRGQLLRKELEFLAKNKLGTLKKGIRQAIRRPPPARVMEALRELAETAMLERKITEIRPEVYRRAEARASKEATGAALKGDWGAAAEAKQRELLNYELHRASSEARERFVAGAEYLNKFTKREALQRIGRADYVEQITRLLGRFGILPPSVVEEAERKSLASWVKEKQGNGESMGEFIQISEKLLSEDFHAKLADLTHEDFTGLVDAVKQIEHIAIAQEKVAASEKKETREEAKRQLLDSIGKAQPPRPPGGVTDYSAPLGERVGKVGRKADTGLLKVERFFNWADQDDIGGAFHRFMFNPASEAQGAELDLHVAVTGKIAKAMNAMPKEIRKDLKKYIMVPGYEGGLRLTRMAALGIGLNAGNDSNWSKMVRGEEMKKGGFTESELHSILDQLTKPEWDFIQGLWDTLESLWPMAAALHRELTGLEPVKLTARPIQTRFGTYRGGYYPVMYDRNATAIGQRQEDDILDAKIGDFQGRGYSRASLPSGYRKARSEEYAAPMDFNISRLPIQVAGEIKDLTHRKWLIDQNWILSDRDIRSAINERFGPEYLQMLNDWVRRITNDRNISNLRDATIFDKIVEQFRANTIVAALGFKASSTFSQVAGVGPIVDMIGLDYYRKGFQKFASHPLNTFTEMKEKSGEMRHRVLTKDQNMRDEFRRLEGRTDPIANLKRFAMGGIVYGEAVISTPAWWGGFYKALDENGGDEKLAVHYADSVVRLTQGAAGAKDLAKVMTSPLMKLFTMFYTPGSALYSQIRDVIHKTKSPADLPQAMLRLWWVVAMPAAISQLTSGKVPSGDDDDGWGKWAAKTLVHYPTTAIPLLRDATSAILQDYQYNFTPLTQVGDVSVKAIKTGKKYLDGDADVERLGRDLFRASGYWLGLPTGQISITGEYMIDLAEGDIEPGSFAELLHDLVYRRPKERNRD